MITYKGLSRKLNIVSEEGDSGFNKVKINSSKIAAEYCRQFFHDDLTIYESFFILLINRANNTIGYVKISQGGVVGTVVDASIVAKYAIESLASGVILCHNHPSGNTQPSTEDINLTRKIKEGLALFDIAALDHIILTEDDYYSFADDGKMP
jgi:DNA repair protein RadC